MRLTFLLGFYLALSTAAISSDRWICDSNGNILQPFTPADEQVPGAAANPTAAKREVSHRCRGRHSGHHHGHFDLITTTVTVCPATITPTATVTATATITATITATTTDATTVTDTTTSPTTTTSETTTTTTTTSATTTTTTTTATATTTTTTTAAAPTCTGFFDSTEPGFILFSIPSSNGHPTIGYLNSEGTSGTQGTTLTISNSSPGGAFDLNVSDDPFADVSVFPFFGLAGGTDGTNGQDGLDYDLGPGLGGYAFMTLVGNHVDANTPATVFGPHFIPLADDPVGNNLPIESQVWTIDCATRILTPHWTNADGSQPVTIPIFAFMSAESFGVTGDIDAFQTINGISANEATLTWVPLSEVTPIT